MRVSQVWHMWDVGTHQDLVEEVLDELLLQRSGGKQAVEIGSEQFGNEITKGVSVWC